MPGIDSSPSRFRALPVYTSGGAGIWDPSMRIGTHPEMVLPHFE
jgi:predicted MPP superfamily phosphohydrolase